MNRAGHVAGALALVPSPVAAHDTVAPLTPEGTLVRASYAVLHDMGADAPPDDGRYTKAQTADAAVTWRIVVKAVGVTPFAARSVDSAVAAGLVGQVPVVAGRSCDPLRIDDIGPVKPDMAVSPPLFFTETHYLLTSKGAI